MNLPTITMPRHEARKAFVEYRTAVRESIDREAATYDERRRETLARRRETDEALAAGYRMLAQGSTIIDLERAIREGGEDEEFRPRLAITRADQEQIRMRRWRDGSVSFDGLTTQSLGPTPKRGSRSQRQFNLPAGTLSPITQWFDATAITPIIPPHLRPESLERYHVLWEAEWRQATAPRDPALLRALGGGLYAVLAVWDLTEIERTVLGLARR